MPMHDWTRVDAGIFHAFHVGWIAAIQNQLNEGLLPSGYYALAEQHAGQSVADVLTLHASSPPEEPLPPLPDTGGTAVAEAPPRVRRKQTLGQPLLARPRTVAIRHVSGHRLVALVEVVSPANKDRPAPVDVFVHKALSALELGIHLLLADALPPGPHDPRGMHGAILERLGPAEQPYDPPGDEPLTLASYAAGPQIDVYLEHVAPGAPLPPMPLFLRADRYVEVPLEETYQAAYRGMPAFWRDVLDRGPEACQAE